MIGKGILKNVEWVESAQRLSSRFALITDEHVAPLWGSSVKDQLETRGLEVHLLTIPVGEESKSRRMKERLEDQMLALGLGRDAAVIAVGGGVVTDLAGFVAATYCRGIPWIAIPTTLMGMVDASIGGKVGVNTPLGKNMIGAFHHPSHLFADLDTLATLPRKELLNGLSEMIKYALIGSRDLFETLERSSLEEAIQEEHLAQCSAMKHGIIALDPFERGLRRVLNFGHTVGHALESASDYRLSHGEAIALGMIVEAYLSWRMGYLQESVVERVRDVFIHYGFSLEIPSCISVDNFIELIKRDKKASGSALRCVILSAIGFVESFEGTYCTQLEERVIVDAIEWMFAVCPS